jgi:hypothetical protein
MIVFGIICIVAPNEAVEFVTTGGGIVAARGSLMKAFLFFREVKKPQ